MVVRRQPCLAEAWLQESNARTSQDLEIPRYEGLFSTCLAAGNRDCAASPAQPARRPSRGTAHRLPQAIQNRTSIDVRGPENQAMRGAGIRSGHVPSGLPWTFQDFRNEQQCQTSDSAPLQDAHTTQLKPRSPLTLSHSAVLTGR